jgi:translocation and assembly module TamB
VTRRKLVALVAVAVFVLLGIVGVSTVLFVTHTQSGRDELRALVQPWIASKFKGGQVYIGRLSELSISEITIDSIAIRDKRGELFVSTGRVTVGFDPRDLIDQRLYFRRARIEHPYVHLVQHENDVWNFKEIFASQNNAPAPPKDAKTRSFGDYVVVDSAVARNGTFLLTLPWRPDRSLRGAARDSVIRVHLETPSKAVTRTFDGFGRLYAWRNLNGLVTHARLADPDSDRIAGKEFAVESLNADEFEPTFQFRKVRATARVLGDSVWFQVPHFNLPASTGTGHGKVWWGSDRPVRYDIAIRGDSVALDDVNWVYPTLPRTGGGSLDLLIKNDPKNEQIIDFKLSKMDVKSTKSHLVGDMSFGTGEPVLLVRNVDLRAEPINFDLMRTLAGKPFPQDWQGDITGAVKARGGPLTNFVVDAAHGVFRDAHVPDAVSRFSGNGELDILLPAFTAFHDFHVDVESLDLRTLEFLNPAFPRLGGFVSGTATLDSSWLDVRFSDADVTHRDGPGEPSHFTGSGRVTYDTLMVYDVALEAQPLSLPMFARSYPNPLTPLGLVSGPIHVKGQTPDLEISTSLRNDRAGISFDGRVDADSVGGYGARGRGQFTATDLGDLLSLNHLLVGPLGVHYDADLTGISATEPTLMRGSVALNVDRTVLDSIRYSPARLRMHFANGEMRIDSARVRTDAATIELAGGIGLPKTQPRDSIRFSVVVDSLGGLRPYISHPDTTLLGAGRTLPDSLSGGISIDDGRLTGTMDSLNVRATLQGTNIYWKRDQGQSLRASIDLRNVLGNYTGSIAGRIQGVTYAGISLDSIGGRLAIDDSSHRRFTAGALSHTGPQTSASGVWSTSGDTNFVRLDAFGLAMADAQWRLAAPSHFVFDTVGTRLDSLLLRNADSGMILARGNVPAAGPATAELKALHIPLRDIGVLSQVNDTVSGIGSLTASVTGTRARPRVVANADLAGVRWYGVDVDRIQVNALAANARVNTDVHVLRGGDTAITANASLPIDVSLFAVKVHDDSLSGTLRAAATELSLLNPILKQKATLAGQVSASLTAAGTWLKPTLDGKVTVQGGTASIQATGAPITNINGDATWNRGAGGQDSVSVALTATGGGKAGGNVALTGFVKNLLQPRQAQPLRFAFGADAFHVFNKRTLADLYISTVDPVRNSRDSLRLTGSVQAPVFTGNLNVDRGSIFLADRDIARKQSVEVLDDTLAGTAESKSRIFSTLMSNLQIPNATITLGDVRLRSAEANVRLTGGLRLTTSTARSTRTSASTGQLLPQFSLEGALRTAGGTYNLNLGLAQREFSVLNDGTVTFDGPWQNPDLDIRAMYTVRRAGDRDLGVIVNLVGPLVPYPGIEFSSNAGYEISQSDLVSYLITGKPGFDFGSNPQAAQVISSFLGPTVSAIAADKLRQSGLGSLIDVFRFQLGSTNTSAGTMTANPNGLSQYLYGSTIDVEQQFKSVFVSANVGFCQFAQNQGGFNAFNALGAKAEYRFDPKLSLKLSYDPPTAGRVCTGQQIITGFQLTPWQLSLSLLHTWRF